MTALYAAALLVIGIALFHGAQWLLTRGEE